MPTEADRRARRRMEEKLATDYGWPAARSRETRRLRRIVTVAELLLAAIAVGLLALLGSGWSP